MAHPEYLGKYTIKTLLGEGAMGVVYKAFDPSIGRLVAIKTIRQALSQDRSAETSLADRFRNEARAVGRLSHPNIVAIYDMGQEADNAYIVMEYVEGRDLSKILEAAPNLPEADVLDVMRQLLDALECAHRQGVWHRDIKPANLIISAAGQLKVTDFGIARIESAALTMVTTTIGTPGYMAPEQYTGEAIDHRIDIFAAGVLLYRLLAGKAPFTGTPEAVMYGIMTKDPAPLGQFLAPDAAAFYDAVLARAMAKNPAQRFATAAAFSEALRARSAAAHESSGQTTIVSRVAQEAAHEPASRHAFGFGSGALASTTSVTHWEDATLARVQAALARYMGPMAKVQVRQAARKCSNLPDLVALLAQDMPDPQQRTSFIEQLQTQYAATLLGTTSLSAGSATAASGAGAPGLPVVPAELIDLATRVMTRLMGPIAKIVVKKMAARAQSRQQFLALLAQELPQGPKRDQLLSELSPSSLASK